MQYWLALALPDIPNLPADALPKPEELIVELDALEKKLKCVSPSTLTDDLRALALCMPHTTTRAAE